jgi:hypothetical protein
MKRATVFAAIVLVCALGGGAQARTLTAEAQGLQVKLDQAGDACRGAVATSVGAAPTLAGAAIAFRAKAGLAECVGLKPQELNVGLPNLIDAVSDEIGKQQGEFGCVAKPERAECLGLSRAAERRDDLALLQKGKVEAAKALGPLRYNRERTYVWNRRYSAFGVNADTGTSFLRLVVHAVEPGGALEQRIRPDTEYTQALDAELRAATTDCPAECQVSVARVVALFPLFDALDSGFMLATAGNYDVAITKLEGIVGRWDAYHFGGGLNRAQLPWELVVNSVIYSANRDDDRIWHEPPNGAVVFVHPTVGLGLKDSKGKDSRINAVVEVLGYSWWRYDAKTYGRTSEWGVSAIAVYDKRDDAKDWSYGALVRTPLFNNVGFAWARTKLKAGGHDDLFAVTVDVSSLVPKMDAACLFKLPSCDKE